MRKFWTTMGLALLLAITMAFAACGGDDDDSTEDGATPTVEDDGDEDATATPTANGNGDEGDLTDVTLMLDWTPNTNHLGLYVAQAEGWYEDAGLNVEIVEPGAGGVPQVVAQGAADFGISVQEAVIPARAQDVPVVAIAAIIQHNTSSLMSLAEDGIERPRDMEGMAYGGFGGPLETAIVETLVECDGGDPAAVTFTDVGNVDYLVGMERDQYEFVWIFDGWDGIRAEELEGADVNFVRFADHFDCIPDWYTPMIITSEDLAEDDPETVEAFMEATTRGYEFAMDDPSAAADILLEEVPELEEELVRLSADYLADRYVDEGRQWGLQDEEIWERFEAFLREAGLTEDEIDVGEAYTNEFLPSE